MPSPTKDQLQKINKLAHTQLEEDQVYVFRSLSADTLPVQRFGWFGEYNLIMNSNMLNSLKKDYQTGVGLLASHDNGRLPFGRTFDAEVTIDHVDGKPVETMYVDHYIVTHVKDEEGNKVPLRTEVNGMTTQDIVNHIDVGHTFDTSIGFAISEPQCSICKNDIRDHEKCNHLPGNTYDVQIGDKTEKMRCDIIANSGEGLENSLVYAGAVNRAIIKNSKYLDSDQSFSEALPDSVNNSESTLYNVDDIKQVPLHSQLLCRMSKGNIELFTTTPERKNTYHLKGSEPMPTNQADTAAKDVVSLTEYNKVLSEKEDFSSKLTEAETKVAKFEKEIDDLKEKLGAAEQQVAELSVKSQLADKFTKDLIDNVVEAGVKARGNAFNKERYQKYAETLSVDELKEELAAFQSEFPGSVEEARVTSVELQEKTNEQTVVLSKTELREQAAKSAMETYRTKGGNLEELTRNELAKLQSQSN